MNGAKHLLDVLLEHDVSTVFGYPGGAVIPLYHEWYSYREKIKHIRCSHEQHAVHAADGYARASGKVGVCFVTSGPGATNTITGIATAYMDSVPLVVISGQVPTTLLGKDSFQEIDMTGLTFSITKHNFLVRSIEDLDKTLRLAFKIASEGRPGPVVVDIPKDLFIAEVAKHSMSKNNHMKLEKLRNESEKIDNHKKLEYLIDRLKTSKKPLFYIGGGIKICFAEEIMKKISEYFEIPIVNTLMGLGTIDRNHYLSLGLVGMHGSKEANMSISECDLLVAVGARFSDRVIGNPKEFAKQAEIIHLDLDQTEVNKNIRVDSHIVGDLYDNLKYIVENLKKEAIDKAVKKERREWLAWIRNQASKKVSNNEDFTVDNIFSVINKEYDENTIFATDVGQHQMWTAQKIKFKDTRSFITSGGLGTMGFGLGAAIGAKIAKPMKNIVLITGDGSFKMNLNELSTISDYKIKVDIILIENKSLGMVRQWQSLFQEAIYAETSVVDSIDYQLLAQAYGLKGFYCRDLEELKASLKKAKTEKMSTLTVVKLNSEEMVLPIVPPGKGISNFIE